MARQIEKALVAEIDKRLEKNGLAQLAIKKKDARTLMTLAASSLVGVKEATGRNDGKLVKLLQETVGGASGEAWCMSFVQSCIAYAEVKTGKKSPVRVSELCYDVWHKTPKSSRVKYSPLPGAIAIWNNKGKTTGHTEIVLGADDKNMNCVGGNTSGSLDPDKTVNPDGNGVYFTKRTKKGTASRPVLGWIKPF